MEADSLPPWSSLVYMRIRLPSGSYATKLSAFFRQLGGSEHTSNTNNQPLTPVNSGECVVPHRSNQSIHFTKSFLPCTDKVTGSQPLSFKDCSVVCRSSTYRPDHSAISQTAAKREPSLRMWSRFGMRLAPTTRSYQASETSRLETANLR